MYYIIQENLFKEPHYNLLINFLDNFNVGYEVIKFRPFTEELEFVTNRKDVWCWGSANMSKLAYKYDWKPGSMYNENHDIDIYGPKYGDNMLNHDGITMNLTDELPAQFEVFFARPTKDTKAFSGQLFDRKEWTDWVKGVIKEEAIAGEKILTNERIFIASTKAIEQEIRCWVVKGIIITTSLYKLGSRVIYQNYDHELYITRFAQSMANIYQPADAFVMDVCLTGGELKIVEINCINCAGFYYANMDKLMEAIEYNSF